MAPSEIFQHRAARVRQRARRILDADCTAYEKPAILRRVPASGEAVGHARAKRVEIVAIVACHGLGDPSVLVDEPPSQIPEPAKCNVSRGPSHITQSKRTIRNAGFGRIADASYHDCEMLVAKVTEYMDVLRRHEEPDGSAVPKNVIKTMRVDGIGSVDVGEKVLNVVSSPR